jgi:hypothetical protein
VEVSRFELGRLFFDAGRDREMKLVSRYHDDPASVLSEYDLTEAERLTVLNKDVRAIYEAGVPPLLVRMGVMYLMGGMDTPTYKKVLAGAVQRED